MSNVLVFVYAFWLLAMGLLLLGYIGRRRKRIREAQTLAPLYAAGGTTLSQQG